MGDEIIQMVSRVPKKGAGLLRMLMLIFGVLFLLAGVMLDRGFMLPCFLMVALYYLYRTFSVKDYEYILDGRTFSVDRILGKAYRRRALEVDLEDMTVLAPHAHEAVAAWRKGSGKRFQKEDFTSYREDIPYYTMILEKEGDTLKVLLDLNDEMLQRLKYLYPRQVIRQSD